MKKGKIILLICLIVIVGADGIFGYYSLQNWPLRFRARLDRFFGEGKWECISEETKESIIYSEYVAVHSNPELSYDTPGKYRVWNIRVQGPNGEELWRITDHPYRINHDRYGLFSSKRYSARQAFTLELMDISHGIVGETVHKELIEAVLSPEQAECIEVSVMYRGGNPEPDFYDALWKQGWFTAGDATAENYLASDLHDFSIYIRAHDYRVKKLSDEQRLEMMESMDEMIDELCSRYGENAHFEIYLDSEHKAEYVGGQRQG